MAMITDLADKKIKKTGADAHYIIKNHGQGRLFENENLEKLTKSSPIVIFSIYIPLIAGMLYYGVGYKDLSVARAIVLFFAGMIFWSFFEYLMHRYIFHFITDNPRLMKIIYKFHGVHHEYPRDKERLFMPPIPSLIIATILFSLAYLALGWQSLAFFPGFIFGYLLYGSIHYAIHAFPPPRGLKALWRNHHLHHYKYPDRGFGVSSVLWDVIFRTVPKEEKKRKTGTVQLRHPS